VKIKCIIRAILLILGISLTCGPNTWAQTRLGLFVTKEELAIWKDRAKNGPYKSKGDVSSNSPGDWDRIVQHAKEFLANPSRDHAKGQPKNTCLEGGNIGDPGGDGRNNPGSVSTAGWYMADAGLYYLITGDKRYADAVRKELISQASEPGMNFYDRKRFCLEGYKPWNGSYIEYPLFITKLLFAYDYIKDTISDSDRAMLLKWFKGAALFFEAATITRGGTRDRFPNRDSYTKDSDYGTPVGGSRGQSIPLYYGGPVGYSFHHYTTSNTKTSAMVPVALIGIATNDSFLKQSAKKYVKESLMFGVFPEGAITDFKRGADKDYKKPCNGWAYSTRIAGDLIIIADAFARAGDPELYNYSTTHGYYGTQGVDQLSGKPKSIRTTVNFMTAYEDKTFNRYMTDNKKNVGNQYYRIWTQCGTGKGPYVNVEWAISNVFFKDNNIKSIYMRTKTGTPPYPASPAGNPFIWGGNHGMFPGLLFMFGQMEGKVWPYPSSNSSVVPSPPSQLRIVED
jgi:hypothetical protein